MNVSEILAKWSAEIGAACHAYGIRPELLAALIAHESGGDPNAVGDGGLAVGLCQMHPNACHDVGADWTQMRDPRASILAGAAYLARMAAQCGGKEDWALGAFNQGPTVIGRALGYAAKVLALIP